MDLRGRLETEVNTCRIIPYVLNHSEVDADGNPVRYQEDAYVSMYTSGHIFYMSIWVVPQKLNFCPLAIRTKVFFIL